MSSIEERVALVVGAGGPTGGPFIWAALEELESLTGWKPSTASTIIGTSAGAFVAAAIPSPACRTTGGLEALAALENAEAFGSKAFDATLNSIRIAFGRLLAHVAPTGRDMAAYRVPTEGFHPGAQVPTVRRRFGVRVLHRLVDHHEPVAVVRASAAIPFVNRPVDIAGVLHVDGAMHSATNVDVVDVDRHDALVVIAPMVGEAGGSIVTRLHRAQLRHQLRPWIESDRVVVVVVPDQREHADRRNVDSFRPAGTAAARRLRKR